MGIRNYSNTGQTSTLSAAIGATDTSFTLAGYAGDPLPPFTAALARGTATEEIVLVTAVVGSTVTVTRGYDGTNAQAQGAGATFQEVVVAQDFREANNHVNATSGAHGITGSFVGTSDIQTLTNKTLTSPTLTGATLNGTSAIATANVTTLTVTGVSTLANASVGGTLGVTGATTLTGALAANGGATIPTGFKLTLTDAPSAGTDAANKTYVDGQITTLGNSRVSIGGDLGGTATAPTVTGGTHHTHTSAQVSDATSAATANMVVKRDASGRAQVATPSAAADIATKSYVDNGADSAWIAVTGPYGSGWVDYGAGYQTPRYRKDRDNRVEVQGLIKSGTDGTIMTLPVAYRPAAILMFPVVSSSGPGIQLARILVNPDGTVVASASASGFLSLNFVYTLG